MLQAQDPPEDEEHREEGTAGGRTPCLRPTLWLCRVSSPFSRLFRQLLGLDSLFPSCDFRGGTQPQPWLYPLSLLTSPWPLPVMTMVTSALFPAVLLLLDPGISCWSILGVVRCFYMCVVRSKMHIRVSACVCGGQKTALAVLPQLLCTRVFEAGPFTSLGLTN